MHGRRAAARSLTGLEDAMETPLQIIDAFIDGERVNAAELKHVLADASARDYLVDAWLLRESLQETMTVETPAPMPQVPPAAGPTGAAGRTLRSGSVVGRTFRSGSVVGRTFRSGRTLSWPIA